MSDEQRLVYVCEGGDCTEAGSGDIYEKLKELVLAADPDEQKVRVRRYPCFGGCECAVNVTVFPDKLFYSRVKEDDLSDVAKHLTEDGPAVDRLTGAVEPDIEEMAWMMLDSPY